MLPSLRRWGWHLQTSAIFFWLKLPQIAFRQRVETLPQMWMNQATQIEAARSAHTMTLHLRTTHPCRLLTFFDLCKIGSKHRSHVQELSSSAYDWLQKATESLQQRWNSIAARSFCLCVHPLLLDNLMHAGEVHSKCSSMKVRIIFVALNNPEAMLWVNGEGCSWNHCSLWFWDAGMLLWS